MLTPNFTAKHQDIRAVIFDMDGLLFDTESLYLDAWPHVGIEMGIAITPEVARATIGHGAQAAEQIFQSHYGSAYSLARAIPIMDRWLEKHVAKHGLPLKPGAFELLAQLQEKEIPIALGTSNMKSVADAYLAEAGLDVYFPVRICGDMVEKPKPAPDIFLRCAERLNVLPQHCLVLDDSPTGILAAIRAGCIPAMVPDLIPPPDELRDQIWRVFGSLYDVIPLFTGNSDHFSPDDTIRE